MTRPLRLTARGSSEDGYRFAVAVPEGCSLFTGHFPGQPILPGISHLALAQWALGEIMGKEVALAAVRSLKLRRPVVPGNLLELRIGIAGDKGVARFGGPGGGGAGGLRRGGGAGSRNWLPGGYSRRPLYRAVAARWTSPSRRRSAAGGRLAARGLCRHHRPGRPRSGGGYSQHLCPGESLSDAKAPSLFVPDHVHGI